MGPDERAQIDQLYQEIILDHYRRPRNRGSLERPDLAANEANPLCGDELCVHAQVRAGRITAVRFAGRGCAISLASASMMTERVAGLTLAEAQALADRLRALLAGPDGPAGEDLGDLRALQGVRKFPVRVKCALLAWSALCKAIAP